MDCCDQTVVLKVRNKFQCARAWPSRHRKRPNSIEYSSLCKFFLCQTIFFKLKESGVLILYPNLVFVCPINTEILNYEPYEGCVTDTYTPAQGKKPFEQNT